MWRYKLSENKLLMLRSWNKKALLKKEGLYLVPRVGIEPTLQRNTSLSRARLPIPPPRHLVQVDRKFSIFILLNENL